MKVYPRRWAAVLAAILLFAAYFGSGRWLAPPAFSATCDPLDQWQTTVIDASRPTRAVFIDAADLDGDHYADIVTGAWWYENPGTPGGAWQRHTIGAPLAQMAVLWDFDGDTDTDILGTATSNPDRPWLGNAFVYAENDGSGGFTIRQNLDAGGGDFLQGVAAGRFRGATTEVILSWHNGAPLESLTVPANPSTGRWTIRDFSTTTQKEDLSAGKIDADADLDLLLGTKWLENNGAADGWPARTLFTTSASPDRNELALINADARLDAVIGYEAISVAGKLAWYEQPANATAAWTEHVIATVTGPMSLDAADMDGDGDTDVVVGEHNLADPANARMLVFENADGEGGDWTQHLAGKGYEHHDGAQTVDLDRDDDLDIISIGWGHNKVLVYENLGCDDQPPTQGTVAVSSTSGGTVGGVAFADEDILTYDVAADRWSLRFDGSDVGLSAADVDAFDFAADGALWLSFDAPVAALTGLTGPVDDSDIVAFRGTFGPNTAGSFSWIFDGSDAGLETDGEDVDALGLLPDGRLLLSTAGAAKAGTASAADEDLLAFAPSQLGATTAGIWALHFDGSDVGLTLASEDLSGLWSDPASGDLYLSFAGAFGVPGASGDDDDLLVCVPLSTGGTTRCDFGAGVVWDGGDHGFGGEKVDGLWLDELAQALAARR
jgi:hypothetical protein